jgi:hypothetical protein
MESSEDGTPEVASPSIDLGQIEEYLQKICPVLLDSESAQFEAALKTSVTQEKLKKFISDSKIPALLVRKRVFENAEEEVGGMITHSKYKS